MRKLAVFLLSLLTIVGGHIMNRRADKALLFFSLLLVASLLNLFLYPLLSLAGLIQPLLQIVGFQQFLTITIVFSLVIIAFTSAVVSYFDARNPPEVSSLTLPAVIGGVLSILIILPVFTYMATYASINLTIFNQASDSESLDEINSEVTTTSESGWTTGFGGSDTHFWHNARYSSSWIPEGKLIPLPKGNSYLSGRIVYKGKPAAGVTLEGVFNSHFVSDEVTTNEDGLFTFKLAEGDWYLNRISTKTWSQKPSSQRFTLISGANSRLTEQLYDEYPNHGSDGLVMTATPAPEPDPKLVITIRDNINLSWPSQERIPAELSNDAISWQPVTDAATYQVQLHRIERGDTSTSFYPNYWKNTSATSLPLEQIQTTSATEGSINEYQVVVYAFDEAGRLLSTSPKHFPMRSMEIEGRQIPSMQQFPSLISGTTDITEQDIEQMQEEKKLIDAAIVLAKADMPSAARELMGKITSKHMQQRQDTLQGLILTAEGQCDAARIHFESINLKWKRDCLPDFYKQRCQLTQHTDTK